MKVVRIIARLNVGGPARHVSWLTGAHARAGVETVLVAGVVPPGEEDMGYFARREGVEPVIIPEMSREISPKDAVTVWKLFRLLLRERPDVVHTHTAKAGTVGRAAGMLYRWLTPSALWGRPRPCRFVHTYHGHIFHSYYGRAKTRLFLAVERALARATDRIVVISPQQYREIHEQFGVGRAAQFEVVPLGLDTSVFAGWPRRRDAERARLGAAPGDVLVGIVGRLTEIKNHALFLEAAARLLARRRDAGGGAGGAGAGRVHFLVVGDGHLRGPLEAQARSLGLGADVLTFTGSRDDPEDFYPALDVVALTSLNEGTPLTIIEALANERAVVATAVGGVVDLLGPEVEPDAARGFAVCERGVIVARHDADDFAAGLERLAADASLRQALGGRGRAHVEANYTKERLVGDVLGLYERLLGAGESARGGRGSSARGGPVGAVGAARLKGD